MQVPDKVQTAVELLSQFDMPADRVTPFGYRQFLRFRPDTPPPLWGASSGYWHFHAWLTALSWGTVVTLVVGGLAWQETHDNAPGRWVWVFGWQGLIWVVAGIFGWADACEKRRGAAREAAVLGLPDWQHFHAQWRPSLENLRHRSEPVHYWLRSLWRDALVNRAGVCGVLSFVAVALLIPNKAGSHGEGIAMAYVALSAVGFARTHRRKPLPQGTLGSERAAGWRCANGFWIGSILAAVVWEAGASQLMGYQPGYNTLYFALAAFTLHASEWVSFGQQKGLAMRAERAEQRRQLAEVRLQMLKNQIEPHFIFNTLAHLKALIKSDPLTAESMADELSDFLRASLKSLREERVTVTQDFELIRAFLALASLRMGARLHVHLQMDPEAAKLLIPPLMLQTLVENAIEHGIEPKAGDGHIRVSASLDRSAAAPMLALQVQDDGVGFAQNQSTGAGIGLANIRERLATAHGAGAKLTLTANTPQGLIATLLLPIQNQA